MAVEGEGAGGGEGVLVATPWLRGEAGHAWGLAQATQRLVLTLPWPGGRLMRRSHWELWFLHREERGWVKLQRTGRKLECIPR